MIAIAFSLFIIGLSTWVSVPSLGLHFRIDASSVSSNNTVITGSAPSNVTVVITDGDVVFAKIALQNIPTIINGITTATSIIVALSGVVIGFMVRELFQSDKKAKVAFFGVFFAFIYVFMYLFWVYVFLATGGVDLALRWSLAGFLLSVLIFILVNLLGSYRLDMQKKRKSEKAEPDKKDQSETSDTIKGKSAKEVKIDEEEKQRDKLIYEMVGHRYNQEWKRTNDLDSKASSIIGFAGLLATLLATLTAGIKEFFPHANYNWLFIIPLVLFVISAIAGLWAYWITDFIAVNPEMLIQRYKDKTEIELIKRFTATTSEHTMINWGINQRKARSLYAAFSLLIVAIGLFLAITIINLVM